MQLDLASPQFQHDPYPTYHWLQEHEPVHRLAGDGVVHFVTRYADVIRALRDPRLLAPKFPADELLAANESPAALHAAYTRLSERPPVQPNPPRHARVRALINRLLTPQAVERWRPLVVDIVDMLLDDVASQRRMDVVAELAAPLPMMVIGALLGVPKDDLSRLWRWSDALSALADHGERSLAGAADATAQLRAHLVAELARPHDIADVSLIAQLQATGEPIDVDDLLHTTATMLAAGNETTQDLIGNGLHALVRWPSALEVMRARPQCIVSAVEELLRYDAPVQIVTRFAVRQAELAGHPIEAGEEVQLAIGAANRDPTVFVEPDRLDVERQENKHVAFGLGAHYCMAAALARLEGQVAIRELVRRAGNLCIAAEPVRRRSAVLRGLKHLLVRW